MLVLELKEATKDKAFELLDEIKDLGHQKKLALCELEDTLYECFENEQGESDDMYGDSGIDYRSRRSYRGYRSLMRNMRDDEDDMSDPMDTQMRAYRRRNMRMRRNKMGRFA